MFHVLLAPEHRHQSRAAWIRQTMGSGPLALLLVDRQHQHGRVFGVVRAAGWSRKSEPEADAPVIVIMASSFVAFAQRHS